MAVVIAYGMIGSLLIFAAVVETLKAMNYEPLGMFPGMVLEILRYALLAMTAVEFFAIRFIRRTILSGGGRVSGLSNQGDPLLPKVQKLFTSAIVSLAFCESVGIYGLVLFVVAGSTFDFYLFIALSLVFFAVYFPKSSQWEEWVSSGG
jgi:hypothetical protein